MIANQDSAPPSSNEQEEMKSDATETSSESNTSALLTSEAVETFAGAVLSAPWGSISKSELDLLIFTLLLDSGKFGKDPSDFSLAEMLRITPARVRTLRFRYEQRIVRADPTRIAPMMTLSNFSFGESTANGYFEVSIHRTYLREYFSSKLMERRSVIYERTPSVLTVNREEFLRIIIDAVFGTEWPNSDEYADLFTALVHSKNESKAEKALSRLVNSFPKGTQTADSSLSIIREIGPLVLKPFSDGF